MSKENLMVLRKTTRRNIEVLEAEVMSLNDQLEGKENLLEELRKMLEDIEEKIEVEKA